MRYRKTIEFDGDVSIDTRSRKKRESLVSHYNSTFAKDFA